MTSGARKEKEVHCMHKTSLAREKQGELFSVIAELDPAAIQALLWSHRPALPPAQTSVSGPAYRQEVRNRFQLWQEIMTPALAA